MCCVHRLQIYDALGKGRRSSRNFLDAIYICKTPSTNQYNSPIKTSPSKSPLPAIEVYIRPAIILLCIFGFLYELRQLFSQ